MRDMTGHVPPLNMLLEVTSGSVLAMNARFGAHVLVLGLVAAASAGCGTRMKATRLDPPVTTRAAGLVVVAPEVHLSAALRRWDFDDDSRVLVVLQLESEAPLKLNLRKARLRIDDPLREEAARAPVASGVGEPPRRLRDGEFAPPIRLTPGKKETVWIAFGGFAERSAPQLAEVVVLELPVPEKPEAAQTLVLSDPGRRPIWRGKPVSMSAGFGYSFQLSADESALNLCVNDSRWLIGPLALGYGLGLGFRFPQGRSEQGDKVVFPNIALHSRLAWPVLIGHMGSLSPYLGFEAAILGGDDDVRRRNWFGPSLGVDMALLPLVPRSGPFPVDYPHSALGAVHFTVGLVHWFGPDREPPHFGMVMSLSYVSGF